MGIEEGILIEDLNLEKVEKVRKELPLLKHIREDIYSLLFIKIAKKGGLRTNVCGYYSFMLK